MEKQDEQIPYSNWPWWVKIITIPMSKPIDPMNHLLIVIGFLFFTSLVIMFKIIPDLNPSGKSIIILLINLSILILWQALGMFWIRKNSSWNLIKTGTLKKILIGFLLFVLVFGYPILSHIL